LLSREDAPDIVFEFVDWAEENAKGITVGAAQKLLLDMGYRIYYFNKQIRQMKESVDILKRGFYMLFATKKDMQHN
jgi:hypothetical protein